MPDARITIEGRLAADPRFSATQNGTQVANLRVLAGRSRREDDGTYTTLSTTAYECAFFGAHNDLVASLNPGKGDSVVVSGRLESLDSYNGANGLSLSARVNADGLRVFPRRQQGGYQQASAPQGGGQGSYDDPAPF